MFSPIKWRWLLGSLLCLLLGAGSGPIEDPHSLEQEAQLYHAQGRYAEAEPLFRRSLAIAESALGPDHPDVATSLNNLAGLYRAQGRYAEAEPLFRRSLAIAEKALRPDHPDVALILKNYLSLPRKVGRVEEVDHLGARTETRTGASK